MTRQGVTWTCTLPRYNHSIIRGRRGLRVYCLVDFRMCTPDLAQSISTQLLSWRWADGVWNSIPAAVKLTPKQSLLLAASN